MHKLLLLVKELIGLLLKSRHRLLPAQQVSDISTKLTAEHEVTILVCLPLLDATLHIVLAA